MERYIRNIPSRIAVLVLLVVAMMGCARSKGDYYNSWPLPHKYLNLVISDEVCTLANDAYVVILAEQWAAIDSIESREKFMKEYFRDCRLEEHTDSIEIFYPQFFDAYYEGEVLVRPSVDTVRSVIYREVYPEATLSTEVGAVRSYGDIILSTLGENRFNVERRTESGVTFLADILHRSDHQDGFDMFRFSGLRAGTVDGLELKYSLEEVMVQMGEKFTPLTNERFYMGSLHIPRHRFAIFNGRIEVAVKSSSMSVPDKFFMEYNYTNNYDVDER